jgi:hypothetical protein
MLFVEHRAHVLELVFNRPSRSGGEECLEGSIDLCLDRSLSASLGVEHREIGSDKGVDLPSPPCLARLGRIGFQFSLTEQ